jgi:hypothetical protein
VERYRNILRHVMNFSIYKRDTLQATFIISFASTSCFPTRWPLAGLTESFGGRIWGFPLSISVHRGSTCMYIIWGTNNIPVGGCNSETQSHPIDITITMGMNIRKGDVLVANLGALITRRCRNKPTSFATPVCPLYLEKN